MDEDIKLVIGSVGIGIILSAGIFVIGNWWMRGEKSICYRQQNLGNLVIKYTKVNCTN